MNSPGAICARTTQEIGSKAKRSERAAMAGAEMCRIVAVIGNIIYILCNGRSTHSSVLTPGKSGSRFGRRLGPGGAGLRLRVRQGLRHDFAIVPRPGVVSP